MLQSNHENNCVPFEPLLSAFADGETSVAEAETVQTHLAVCPACAAYLAFLRVSSRAISHLPDVYSSSALFDRIALATYARPTLQQRIADFLRPAPVRVALGGAVVAGLVVALGVPAYKTAHDAGTAADLAALKLIPKAAQTPSVSHPSKNVKSLASIPVKPAPTVKPAPVAVLPLDPKNVLAETAPPVAPPRSLSQTEPLVVVASLDNGTKNAQKTVDTLRNGLRGSVTPSASHPVPIAPIVAVPPRRTTGGAGTIAAAAPVLPAPSVPETHSPAPEAATGGNSTPINVAAATTATIAENAPHPFRVTLKGSGAGRGEEKTTVIDAGLNRDLLSERGAGGPLAIVSAPVH